MKLGNISGLIKNNKIVVVICIVLIAVAALFVLWLYLRKNIEKFDIMNPQSITGVKTIKISGGDAEGYMGLCGVFPFNEKGDLVNISDTTLGTATQSNNYQTYYARNCLSAVQDNNNSSQKRTLVSAIDGNNNFSNYWNIQGVPSGYSTWDKSTYFSHTGTTANNVQSYWQFEFKVPQTLSGLEVVSRTDCCYARLNLTVTLLDSNGEILANNIFCQNSNQCLSSVNSNAPANKEDAHRVFVIDSSIIPSTNTPQFLYKFNNIKQANLTNIATTTTAGETTTTAGATSTTVGETTTTVGETTTTAGETTTTAGATTTTTGATTTTTGATSTTAVNALPLPNYRTVSGRYLVIRQTQDKPLTIAGIIPIDKYGNNMLSTLLDTASYQTNGSFILQYNDDTKYPELKAEKSIVQTKDLPFNLGNTILDAPDTSSMMTTVSSPVLQNTVSTTLSNINGGNMSRAVSGPNPANLSGNPMLPFLIIDLNPYMQSKDPNSDIGLHGLILFNRTDDGCNISTLPNTLPAGGTNCANDMNSVVIEFYSATTVDSLLGIMTGTATTTKPNISWNYGSALYGGVPLKYKIFTLDSDSTTISQFRNINKFGNILREKFTTPSVQASLVGYSSLNGTITGGILGLSKDTTQMGAIDITTGTTGIPYTTTATSTTAGATSTTAGAIISANGSGATLTTSTSPQTTQLGGLTPEQITALLNSGMNLNSLLSGNPQSVTSQGVNMNSTYKTPNTNIVQTGFSGTSNIFSPYLYYNKNSGGAGVKSEMFANVGNMSGKYNVDKYYRY